jgi:predicted transcriptional regulator
MERIRRAYPHFFGGAAATQIVAALAKHGCMTAGELAALLGWKSKTDVHHRARRLIAMGVIVKYPWFRTSRAWRHRAQPDAAWSRYCNASRSPREVIFALDRRHPWQMKIRTLGRALARGFPLPHPETLKNTVKRPYFGPRSPMHPMPMESVLGYGISDRFAPRVLMLLAHVCYRSNGVPVTKLAKLVGAARSGLLDAVRCFERWGIVRSDYVKQERRVRLDPKFCAYDALRDLCRLMDHALGREFHGLVMARVSHLTIAHNRRRHRRYLRRLANKLYQREAAKRKRGAPLTNRFF